MFPAGFSDNAYLNGVVHVVVVRFSLVLCDRVALHLPKQAVAFLETLCIKGSFLGSTASVLLRFGHLAMHNKLSGSLQGVLQQVSTWGYLLRFPY